MAKSEKKFGDARNANTDASGSIVSSMKSKTKRLESLADRLIVYDPLDRPFANIEGDLTS